MMRENEPWTLERKQQLMTQCFEYMVAHGLSETTFPALARHCGCEEAVLTRYFRNLDGVIVQSVGYGMQRVEDDFMAVAPKDIEDVERFLTEIPRWTAEKHGDKYRLMYQVYTQPKFKEHGKEFFKGVDRRYTDYALRLEDVIGVPYDVSISLIFIFIRACVHYALFEDEYYLKNQVSLVRYGVKRSLELYPPDLMEGEE